MMPIFSGIDREYGCDILCGWLSIERAFNGRAVYKIEGQRITLDDSGYLILDNYQPYVMSFQAPALVEGIGRELYAEDGCLRHQRAELLEFSYTADSGGVGED